MTIKRVVPINYVGKGVSEAKAAGINYRVIWQDGRPSMIASDCKFDRYNFHVSHGVIVKQSMG